MVYVEGRWRRLKWKPTRTFFARPTRSRWFLTSLLPCCRPRLQPAVDLRAGPQQDDPRLRLRQGVHQLQGGLPGRVPQRGEAALCPPSSLPKVAVFGANAAFRLIGIPPFLPPPWGTHRAPPPFGGAVSRDFSLYVTIASRHGWRVTLRASNVIQYAAALR